MKILGLKIAKYRQWFDVLRVEGSGMTLWQWLVLAGDMAKAALSGFRSGLKSRREFRRRLRVCRRCPVYNPALRQCRSVSPAGVRLGCGCWVPLVALLKPRCWATEKLGEEQAERLNLGW